ncbi:MAG: Zn-dependent hydrolase [Flavobacteriales bacterium]|nr:Zn-dependent hydrolase [Bacteroidota bacterium]MCB9240881.1 Zn-dependent hydrolase [Flavobacteriales bacterium]
MKHRIHLTLSILISSVVLFSISCTNESKTTTNELEQTDSTSKMSTYVSVKLTTDLSKLSEADKKMLPHLIQAADVMNELFWMQSFGEPAEFLASIKDDDLRRFADVNYGPWDRLEGNTSFIDGYDDKPLGANIYPADVTKEELESSGVDIRGQYSMVRRDEQGKLTQIPYHQFFKNQLERAAQHLNDAAAACENASFKSYLELRAQALLTDSFNASDIAWLGMKDNTLDIIIGPIENYEDHLYNARTSYEAYVLVKDVDWSKRLEKYISYLPDLQKSLPVEDQYKKESPGSSSQLNAYDVVYYAGDCNAGSKTIAVNLPNDEYLQTTYGTRRSQLKNAMRAKFDHIMLPISDVLIDPAQRTHVTFDAFFENTMFHEVAHGLGIKNTLAGPTVRAALQEEFSPLEEGKADILGLYMVTWLREKNVLTEGELMDNYVTFMAGIFRSVRFGAASAHGKANMVRFNYFQEKGAFVRNAENGTFTVNPEKMAEAVKSLSALILKLQGDGDKAGVQALMADKGMIKADLQADLNRLEEKGIPVDVVFEQGTAVLGLNP